MKRKRQPLYAYRIHISAPPQSPEERAACDERAKTVADILSKSNVKVTVQMPTHVMCRTSFEFDTFLNVLLPIGVKREDVKQERG